MLTRFPQAREGLGVSWEVHPAPAHRVFWARLMGEGSLFTLVGGLQSSPRQVLGLLPGQQEPSDQVPERPCLS